MNLLKKINSFFAKHKNLFIIISLGICLLTILCLANRKPKVITIEKDNSDIMKEVEYHRDVTGKLFAELAKNIIDRKEAEARAEEFAAKYNLKPKTIQGVTVIEQRTDTVFRDIPTTIIRDTIYSIRKKDNYIDAYAEVGPKTGSIKLATIDSLSIVETYKKSLFGKAKRSLLIQNANPYNTIKSGYSYEIKEKTDIIDIGLFAGYDPFRKQVTAGIGITKDIIKIRK